MSRKPEQLVWDAMKRALGKRHGLWMERVENVVADGQPDVRIAVTGHIKEVELKFAKVPARPDTPLLGKKGLRVSQISWHRKAAFFGLPVFTLIRDSEGELYLIHCRHAQDINEMTRAQLRAVSLADTWDSIHTVLAG